MHWVLGMGLHHIVAHTYSYAFSRPSIFACFVQYFLHAKSGKIQNRKMPTDESHLSLLHCSSFCFIFFFFCYSQWICCDSFVAAGIHFHCSTFSILFYHYVCMYDSPSNCKTVHDVRSLVAAILNNNFSKITNETMRSCDGNALNGCCILHFSLILNARETTRIITISEPGAR